MVFRLSAQSCCSRKPRKTVPRIRRAENLRPARDRPASNGRRMGAPRCGSLHRSRGSSWIRSHCGRTAACLLAPADSCRPGAASGRSRFRRHGSRGWSFLASSRHICPASERIPVRGSRCIRRRTGGNLPMCGRSCAPQTLPFRRRHAAHHAGIPNRPPCCCANSSSTG